MVIDHQMPGCSSSPEIEQLIGALCAAQSEFPAIQKSGVMELRDNRFRYSTWADICTALYPALHKHGLVFVPLTGRQGDQFVMMGLLTHSPSGQWISSTCPIRDVVDGMGIRGDSQSFEIATTYAKKTLLRSMAGGWEVGDEQPEQEQAAQQAALSAEQAELLAKVRGQLELVRGNRAKLASVFKKIAAAVQEGRIRPQDEEAFRQEFPIPELEAMNA